MDQKLAYDLKMLVALLRDLQDTAISKGLKERARRLESVVPEDQAGIPAFLLMVRELVTRVREEHN